MSNANHSMSPAEFWCELYGECFGGHLALSRFDTKKTLWTDSYFGIERFVQRTVEEQFDGYFGVCLGRNKKTRGRITKADAYLMPGVWADVDFAGKPNPENKKQKRYAPRDIAYQAIALMPIQPSIIVGTGGGLHVYWLFEDSFLIRNDQDRQRASNVNQRWQVLLRTKLSQLGDYELDGTYDLARVLRPPGSVHTKHPGQLVGVESFSRERHPLDAIEAYCADIPLEVKPSKRRTNSSVNRIGGVTSPALLATETGEPPEHKLENLLAVNPGFKQMWEGHVRKPSPSEYDMSLANYAIHAGWTDNEAAALLVAFRKKFYPNELPKLLRVTNGVQDYLQLTIGKARDGRVADRDPLAIKAAEILAGVESLEDQSSLTAAKQSFLGYALDTTAESDRARLNQIFEDAIVADKQRRASPFELIRKTLNAPTLQAIHKLGTEDASVDFVFAAGARSVTITIGSTHDVLTRPDKVQARLIESSLKIAIPTFTRSRWRPVAMEIMKLAEEVETTNLTRQIGSIVLEAMHTFSAACELTRENFEEAVLNESQIRPGESYQGLYSPVFAIEGESSVFVHLPRLIAFAGQQLHRNLSLPVVAEALRRMAFERFDVQRRIDKKNRLVRLWRGEVPSDAARGD